jgi:hypothetical protein
MTRRVWKFRRSLYHFGGSWPAWRRADAQQPPIVLWCSPAYAQLQYEPYRIYVGSILGRPQERRSQLAPLHLAALEQSLASGLRQAWRRLAYPEKAESPHSSLIDRPPTSRNQRPIPSGSPESIRFIAWLLAERPRARRAPTAPRSALFSARRQVERRWRRGWDSNPRGA